MSTNPTVASLSRPVNLVPLVNRDPFDPILLDYLCNQSKEGPEWDFKKTVSIAKDSDFAKIAKDIFAFSNYGGGYLLVGWEERETGGYEPIGLPEDFHVDQATLQQKFNAFVKTPVELPYQEFSKEIAGIQRRFAAIYVPPSMELLKPEKDGLWTTEKGKQSYAFRKGEVLVRRGTQSVLASDDDVRWIEQRIKIDAYQIGLISGQPAKVRERSLSNLFPIVKLPTKVYFARPSGEKIPFPVAARNAHAAHDDYLYSFTDPRQTELKDFIRGSVSTMDVARWRDDEDGDRRFMWLLKQTVMSHGDMRGMFRQQDYDRLFFPTSGQDLQLRWRGLSKSSQRFVARKMYAQQFQTHIFVHDGVRVAFQKLGGALYLTLTPSFVLTWDGRRIIQDDRVGSVVTRLMKRKFNPSFLRDLLFWTEKLETSPGKIEILAGQFEIASRPLEVELNLGIMSDPGVNLDELPQETIDGIPEDDGGED